MRIYVRGLTGVENILKIIAAELHRIVEELHRLNEERAK